MNKIKIDPFTLPFASHIPSCMYVLVHSPLVGSFFLVTFLPLGDRTESRTELNLV